jgi:multiple sugar transport system ATP-binding protein
MGQLTLRGIRKRFDATTVIHGIDLEVREGEFLVFVGPSGCGKSTLLRMIAGLESITEGELLIDGLRANEVPAAQRGAAMVFQSYALYPHMTVAQNMGFSLRMAGLEKAEREQLVQRTAEVLRIAHLLPRLPKALSGGERQRVAIGRAIVRKPRVFLFDEPLSNLDAALRVTMRIELSRLHKELGTTMIYVTHDQVEAMTMGDRIAVFNQGRIEQLGAPLDLYARPANEFVATFLGSPRINLITRPTPDASAAHAALWTAAAGPTASTAHKLGIRPEHLKLTGPGQGVSAQVVLCEHLGDTSVIHLRVEGIEELLTAKVASHECRLVAGQMAGLRLDRSSPVLSFSEAGQLLG